MRELNVSSIIARLLVNRQVESIEEARFFLAADLSCLHDPFLMKGMADAVDRIVKAILDGESITLFCDYDVDGVTSASFLTHFFRDLGIKVGHYLPERMVEGYGLNEDAVRKIKSGGATLMITADCGITSVQQVRLAHELGLDVIVTDHHQVGPEGLPPALAVLNPHQPDCEYPFKFLSGVGIVFKLAGAVRSVLHRKGTPRENLPNLKRHLDLFALGTIADVAPLTGENHVLTGHGLKEMTVSSKPGLVALKEIAGLNGTVTARSVGFTLGPRLNAAGRLGRADAGFHLLTSTDLKEAMRLARSLDEINHERREVQNQSQEEAEYLMGREVDLDRDRVIVLASELFHSGVIGIVASRLVERYYRPVVLIALKDGIGKGSARSIPAFNLFKAFSECSQHFTQFGGHAYAAGLTIKQDNVDDFHVSINAIGHRILKEEDLVPEIAIDAELDPRSIDRDLYREIKKLEPFGASNATPVFLASGVKIQNLRTMGKEDTHVRFRAVKGNASIGGVGFNMAEHFGSIDTRTRKLDLVYELQINDWNGQEKLEMKLLDLRLSETTA